MYNMKQNFNTSRVFHPWTSHLGKGWFNVQHRGKTGVCILSVCEHLVSTVFNQLWVPDFSCSVWCNPSISHWCLTVNNGDKYFHCRYTSIMFVEPPEVKVEGLKEIIHKFSYKTVSASTVYFCIRPTWLFSVFFWQDGRHSAL